MSKPEPRSPLSQRWPAGRHGAPSSTPLTISERKLSIAVVGARRGRVADLSARMQSVLGLDLPSPGSSAVAGGTTAIWIAPEMWLLKAPFEIEGALAARVMAAAGDAASVVDQSHGKTCLRLAGARARDALDKICRIDLHPRAFGPGRSAVTPVAHLATVVLQVDDQPTFDLILPSTYAATLLEALEMAAEQFGYTLA